MREIKTDVALRGETLLDVDLLPDNEYAALTDKRSVVTRFDTVEIHHAFEFPMLRQLTSGSFLVADARTDTGVDNCFIFDRKGHVVRHFYADDGIQDIEVFRDKIIVTYFDEGVFGEEGPNNYGLVLFDFDGKILFRYNENHGHQGISDCYCVCKHGANSILFLPYTNFRLTELNLDTGDTKQYEIPEQLEGSSGLTSTADSIIFHAPYDDKAGIYRWHTGNATAQRIGEYRGRLRGLKNGRFLSVEKNGFTVLDLNDTY